MLQTDVSDDAAAQGDEGTEEDDSEPAAEEEAEEEGGTSALEWKSAFKLFHVLGRSFRAVREKQLSSMQW